MNSFSNIRTAINNEIETQTKLLDKNEIINSTTKRFDEASQKNIIMREKANLTDYKYFKEPNITPIVLSKEFVNNVKIPTLP